MANGKSKTARRREVRRNMPRPGPKWLRSPRRRQAAWAVCYGALLALLATLIALPTNDGRYRYQVGQTVTDPVVSRVAFTGVDEQETTEARNKAANNIPRVYRPNEEFLSEMNQKLDSLMSFADEESIDLLSQRAREQFQLTTAALKELKRYKDQTNGHSMRQWEQRTQQFLQDLFKRPILSELPPGSEHQITLQYPQFGASESDESTISRSELYKVDEPEVREHVKLEASRGSPPFPKALQPTIVAMVMQNIEPTYIYDEAATTERRESAREAVPPQPKPYNPNQVIVPAGTTLTAEHLDLIGEERGAFEARHGTNANWLEFAGLAAVMLALAAGLWIYIFQYNEKIVRNPLRGLAITVLLLLCQILAVGLTRLYPEILYITAIFPTLLAATVLTIAYDQRFALGVGALHAALVTVSLDLSVGFALVVLVGIGLAVMLLRDVRNRSTVVAIGTWSGLAMGVATLLVAFIERPLHIEGALHRILFDSGLAAVTGVFTGLLVQGILPAIEKVFKVNTSMTLKELNDASHPLLQRLAQEAPGTYQHSLRIADMVESAADAIGGDSLLCRVGAMYHDIGKINKPGYFIENQAGGPNRHSKLSPAMSLLIIVGHVKDGIEMAREYRLPPTIRHFIESHHGTTLVEYFYHAARKQKEAEAAPGPSEFEFRYAGPKPQTKEAAMMLLCDSIEAAARSLAEPTPVRLEQVVHNIATKRLMDGQFDESNLTLKELNRIEAAITKTLCAIYHARIKYPEAQRPLQSTTGTREQPTDPARIQPAAS